MEKPSLTYSRNPYFRGMNYFRPVPHISTTSAQERSTLTHMLTYVNLFQIKARYPFKQVRPYSVSVFYEKRYSSHELWEMKTAYEKLKSQSGGNYSL